MAKSADVVVVDRILDVAPSRIVQARAESSSSGPDSDAWFAGYAPVELEVEWASPAGGAHTFEVFLSTESKYREFLNAPMPAERTIFFLRNKETAALAAGWSAEAAAAERPYFMLVNAEQGAIHDVDGVAQITEDDADDLSNRVDGVPFDAILAEVIRLRE